MRLWAWARRVARDQTGGVEPVPVALERNPGAIAELGAKNPADVPLYVLRVGIRGGFGGETRAGLAVYRRPNPAPHPVLKEIYRCEVAGKVLEAANVHALRAKVQRQLEAIAPARSLPLGYFRAPAHDYSLPVHREGHHLVCPVLAGPRIKADGLAELRAPVLAHLRAAGYLGPEEDFETLIVRPSDLRLVSPAAIVCCLEPGREGLWLPAVEGISSEGPVVGLLGHPAELATATRPRRVAGADPPPSAPDVVSLLRLVGQRMVQAHRLANPWALYASQVRPEIWARTEERTDPTPRALVAHLEGGSALTVPIRHTAAGESVGAIADEAIAVFLAGDDHALAASIGAHLVEAGHLRSPGDLRAETLSPAPAERLDPDSIWTGAAPEQAAAGRELSTSPTHHLEASTT